MRNFALLVMMLFTPLVSFASEDAGRVNLTSHWVGISALLLFFVAYLLVMAEEFTHLRKSKPVMLAAGIIWALIAWYYQSQGIPHIVEAALRHNLLEYAELMLFLLVAMTYINAMEQRNVFEVDGLPVEQAAASGAASSLPTGLRPGLRGVVRIDIEPSTLGAVWWQRASQWLQRTRWRLLG